MMIEENTVVSLSYALTVNEDGNETIVEETREGHPFVFLFGASNLLEAFEGNVRGLKAGDRFDFVIPFMQGYGPSDQDKIIHLPIHIFKDDTGEIDRTMLHEGNVLPMIDSEGNRLFGTVKKAGIDTVLMDFNHPLANKDLRFKGFVISVREATTDEIDHGHVHGQGGHQH